MSKTWILIKYICLNKKQLHFKQDTNIFVLQFIVNYIKCKEYQRECCLLILN